MLLVLTLCPRRAAKILAGQGGKSIGGTKGKMPPQAGAKCRCKPGAKCRRARGKRLDANLFCESFLTGYRIHKKRRAVSPALFAGAVLLCRGFPARGKILFGHHSGKNSKFQFMPPRRGQRYNSDGSAAWKQFQFVPPRRGNGKCAQNPIEIMSILPKKEKYFAKSPRFAWPLTQ